MIPLTRRDPVRFTPEELRGQPGAPVYLIGVPTIAGRAALNRAMAENGAKYWLPGAFCAEARKVIEDAKPDNLSEVVGVIEEVEALPDVESASEELARKWELIIGSLRRYAPTIAAMEADNGFWMQMAPYIYAAHFLLGWENVAVEYRRGADRRVLPEVIEQLPAEHVWEIFREINRLMRPSQDQEKNSASPSSSQPGPATSAAEKQPLTEASGTSSANDTRETRA